MTNNPLKLFEDHTPYLWDVARNSLISREDEIKRLDNWDVCIKRKPFNEGVYHIDFSGLTGKKEKGELFMVTIVVQSYLGDFEEEEINYFRREVNKEPESFSNEEFEWRAFK